jgi:hypothetical protein
VQELVRLNCSLPADGGAAVPDGSVEDDADPAADVATGKDSGSGDVVHSLLQVRFCFDVHREAYEAY